MSTPEVALEGPGPSWRPAHAALRYGLALLFVGTTSGISLLFRTELSSQPSMLFFGAVVATAFLAGLGPSLLATALSVLALEFGFFSPLWSLQFHETQDLIAVATFGGVAVAVSWLADRVERSREELVRQRWAAEKVTRRTLFLSEATRLVGEAPTYHAALRELADFLCREMADYAIAYSLEEDGSIRRVGVAHADPERRTEVQGLLGLRQPRLDDEFGAGMVIRTGKPVLAREISASLLERAAAGHGSYLALLRELDPVSSLLVPLRARGRTVGALALAATSRTGRRYDEDDLALIVELGYRAALVLDNVRLLEEARAAVRTRERVLAVVAHDLRNPLNTIAFATELLGVSGPDVNPTEVRETLKRASRQAADLVEDLVELSRIEAGEFRVSPDAVRVDDVLERARRGAEFPARRKGIRLTVEAGDGNLDVLADRTRLRQVFSNLLDNAFRHTPEGGRVHLSAHVDGEVVVFSVTDEGPGIPERDLPHIFEQFWQGEAGVGRVGLGLAIVRGLVEAHGGRAWVENGAGRGATFRFSLPRALAAAPSSGASASRVASP